MKDCMKLSSSGSSSSSLLSHWDIGDLQTVKGNHSNRALAFGILAGQFFVLFCCCKLWFLPLLSVNGSIQSINQQWSFSCEN